MCFIHPTSCWRLPCFSAFLILFAFCHLSGSNIVSFIFSLLDAWPHKLDETKCVTCMEDLCRLAVMRCPDQPSIASSMPCFTTFASGNADRRQWARHTGLLISNGASPAHVERENTVQSVQSTQLRQLVDLVEVPVHRLPFIQYVSTFFVFHSLGWNDVCGWPVCKVLSFYVHVEIRRCISFFKLICSVVFD